MAAEGEPFHCKTTSRRTLLALLPEVRAWLVMMETLGGACHCDHEIIGLHKETKLIPPVQEHSLVKRQKNNC